MTKSLEPKYKLLLPDFLSFILSRILQPYGFWHFVSLQNKGKMNLDPLVQACNPSTLGAMAEDFKFKGSLGNLSHSEKQNRQWKHNSVPDCLPGIQRPWVQDPASQKEKERGITKRM